MLFDDTYRTIAAPAEGQFRDRGSKFLAFAFPVKTETEVKEHLAQLRKTHFDAVHHCYAFRLGADKLHFRSSDDGEPSGTAGRPIMGQIQSNDLTNILVVVVRYFGGTLLGVPGLINAYREATADALKQATQVEMTINEIYEVHFPYAAMNAVMKVLKDSGAQLSGQVFELECRLLFEIRKDAADRVCDALRKSEGVVVTYKETT